MATNKLTPWKPLAIEHGDSRYPSRLAKEGKLRGKRGRVITLYAWEGTNLELLNAEATIAIVGSRSAPPDFLAYARQAGAYFARHGLVVVTGGARGVDLEAMNGALESGGQAIVVRPMGLESAEAIRFAKRYEPYLAAGKLLVLSEMPPHQRWHARAAMARNRLVVGLADAVLVVHTKLKYVPRETSNRRLARVSNGNQEQASLRLSGTWNAAEQARKLGRPLWVLDGAVEGNRALLSDPELGARRVDRPGSDFGFEVVLAESFSDGRRLPPRSSPGEPEPPGRDAVQQAELPLAE
ncbi:DNA-protecting protein DprA [Thermomicrobiaceae bacterium CFH 74404]|uniref:DNA-protecting protein DprA n=1 Tax=Thermalbibacter longus TaxID=2951981 RepID=A0AA42BAF8_9BACT|nr:DNA-processing protein DprA [Thermalbibacter longus]MCM8748470.1 DNA-protecting protein DprA [Thermalbibacter longus]